MSHSNLEDGARRERLRERLQERRERDGRPFVAPAYDFVGRRIWGVTGFILHDLLDVVTTTAYLEQRSAPEEKTH